MSVLVVAKAPVPGLVKTRLCPPLTGEQAADVAAAALLDTLDAARPRAVVVAMSGTPAEAVRRRELAAALAGCRVVPQRGRTFGARLAAAHRDAARCAPGPVLQIGMDTPQVTAALLDEAADRLARADAVLGPAADGGWWLLGLHDPRHAAVLRGVAMSRADTGERTAAALRARGLRVAVATELRDVDTAADAVAVAAALPGGRFAAAVDAGLAVGAR